MYVSYMLRNVLFHYSNYDKAFRLEVKLIVNNICYWLKQITWYILANSRCCLLQVERLYNAYTQYSNISKGPIDLKLFSQFLKLNFCACTHLQKASRSQSSKWIWCCSFLWFGCSESLSEFRFKSLMTLINQGKYCDQIRAYTFYI